MRVHAEPGTYNMRGYLMRLLCLADTMSNEAMIADVQCLVRGPNQNGGAREAVSARDRLAVSPGFEDRVLDTYCDALSGTDALGALALPLSRPNGAGELLPAPTHRLEGWLGRFKPRARLTRGLKTEAGPSTSCA